MEHAPRPGTMGSRCSSSWDASRLARALEGEDVPVREDGAATQDHLTLPLPGRRQVKECSFHSYDATVEACCPAMSASRKDQAGPGNQ